MRLVAHPLARARSDLKAAAASRCCATAAPRRSFRAVVGRARRRPRQGVASRSPRRRASPTRDGFLGPVALHLTAHSDVLDDYGGGPGRVAIHGRGGASLADPLGSARSHGCVRVDNEAVRLLARVLAPGVPVAVAS